MNLEPGMFVAELDRPWLETPFALQGFVVHDNSEIVYVSNYVDHVYVDAEYSGRPQSLCLAVAPTAPDPRKRLELDEEFQRARISFDSAADTLDKVFDSLRNGHKGDLQAVHSGEYRYHHGVSMAVWAAILGRHIGLHRDELEKLAVGCAMCDVGMTQLPPELLDQAENLTDQQRKIIQAHPIMGAQLVSESKDVDFEILGVIENHHERADGSGYPRGLDGAAIPLLARIAGLVDTYDAMITARPYATARTSHEATQELLDCKGTLFQEALVEQFVQAIGLFPTGTMVELNTGEVAIVVTQNDTRRLKPEVVIVMGYDKEKLDSLKVVDLANQQIAAEGERWIARELLPGTYGINSEEYFI